jgi:hypothetical protein
LEDTTIKFEQQLKQIIQQNKTEDEIISLLKVRCQKAVDYFHEQFTTDVLNPLQSFITSLKTKKKNKTFLQNLMDIEKEMLLFLKSRRKVRYNDIPLVE